MTTVGFFTSSACIIAKGNAVAYNRLFLFYPDQLAISYVNSISCSLDNPGIAGTPPGSKAGNSNCKSVTEHCLNCIVSQAHLVIQGPSFTFFFFFSLFPSLYNMASTLKAAATQATKSTITPTRAFFRVSDNIPSVAHAREVFKTLGSYGDMVEYKLLRVSDGSDMTSMTIEQTP